METSKHSVWSSVGASVIGKSHLISSTKCQDSHFVGHLTPDRLVFMVADGAGSAQKSDIGAYWAIQSAVTSLSFSSIHHAELTEEKATEYLKNVFKDAASSLQAFADHEQSLVKEYATTLLIAIVDQKSATFASVGDCIAVWQKEGGTWNLAHQPERGEYANETTFLTSPNWEEKWQITHINEPIARTALFSDGLMRLALNLSESTAYAPFFDSMFAFARAQKDLVILQKQVEEFLGSDRVNAKTEDDKSLILAWREASGLAE